MDYFIFEDLLLPYLYTERWTLDDLELIGQGQPYRRSRDDGKTTASVFIYRNPNPAPLALTTRFDQPCPQSNREVARTAAQKSIQ